MKSKLTNNHDEMIRLFAKIDDVEQQIDIPPGHSKIVDDYETRTIKIFKQRGFVTMEPAQLHASDSFHILKETTIDENTDPNNDEVMDHFHTTETEKVEYIKDVEYLQKNLFESLQQPMVSAFEVVENEVEQYVEGGFIKGEWTDEDIDFLKKNYPSKGRKFCANELNRNESSVQKKINSLGLKKKKKKKK